MRDGRLRSQLLSAVAAMLANVDSDVSAVGSMVWGDSKGLPLIGPTRWHIHQTRDAEAARKGSVDCCLDYVWSEEGERKSHAGGSFTDAFTSGDRLNAFDPAGNYFVEPSPPLGDGG